MLMHTEKILFYKRFFEDLDEGIFFKKHPAFIDLSESNSSLSLADLFFTIDIESLVLSA